MKRFIFFLFLFLLIVGCSTNKELPYLKNSPTSLKKIEGPKTSNKNDTLLLVQSAIDFVNEFAEGTYGVFSSMDDLKDEMGDYKYSNGTWAWEVTYYTYTYKITCTEVSDGYEWKFYLNDALIWAGYVTKSGDYAWWKWYSGGLVGLSLEFEDESNGGYIKLYNGDIGSALYFWIDWTTTSQYCEVIFHSIGWAIYEYQIREYNDHHGFANVKENGTIIFSVSWDSNGNIVK